VPRFASKITAAAVVREKASFLCLHSFGHGDEIVLYCAAPAFDAFDSEPASIRMMWKLFLLLSLLSVVTAQTAAEARKWILYNADVTHYPYVVHLPDRLTRNLSALTAAPPLVIDLSGSGARGNSSVAAVLAGYDGTSKKVRQYNDGNRTYLPCRLAAEEFIVSPLLCLSESRVLTIARVRSSYR
jgi:hypothetical protein